MSGTYDDVTEYLRPLEEGKFSAQAIGLALELCNDHSRVRSAVATGYRKLAETEENPVLKEQYIEAAEFLEKDESLYLKEFSCFV